MSGTFPANERHAGSMDASMDSGTGGIPGSVEERRDGDRVGRDAAAHLVGWGGVAPIPCTVRNYGESGAFVFALDAPELCVGRRYELVIDADCDVDHLGDVIGEGCFATVVRTEIVEGERVGAGLRFDHPLMF